MRDRAVGEAIVDVVQSLELIVEAITGGNIVLTPFISYAI